MKFLATTVTLSIAAVIPAMAMSTRRASVRSSNRRRLDGRQARPLILAQRRIWVRRSKCTEDLGYGRTGSYGCG
jgi:hypothetical protein